MVLKHQRLLITCACAFMISQYSTYQYLATRTLLYSGQRILFFPLLLHREPLPFYSLSLDHYRYSIKQVSGLWGWFLHFICFFCFLVQTCAPQLLFSIRNKNLVSPSDSRILTSSRLQTLRLMLLPQVYFTFVWR